MPVRGVRGATVAEDNRPEAIHAATAELLESMLEANPDLRPEDLASAFFTVPPELDSAFPALAARSLPAWRHVPLLCSQEVPVSDPLPRVIRVLLHWNTDLPQDRIRHVYLRDTARLRPGIETARR